ncbi:MAG: hypothetical protein QXF97_09110, partial [Candidatus Caldarchaeum sp.]
MLGRRGEENTNTGRGEESSCDDESDQPFSSLNRRVSRGLGVGLVERFVDSLPASRKTPFLKVLGVW